ncbi:Transcription factor Sp2 [Paraphaeosphaeria sporulosa]
MVDYVPYTTANMPHDFELYSHQEQQLDFMPTSQPFHPSTSYSMDPTFNGAFEPQDLQFHYDGIAQGVKATFQQYTSPMASPHSISNSFQEQPPVLSASSESGASVSSSAMGSPSQFNEPWNPLSAGLGFAQGFEYPGMADAVKVPGCVDPSLTQFGNPLAFMPPSPYPEIRTTQSPYFGVIEHPPSPALSNISSHSRRPGSNNLKRGSASPFLNDRFQPYPAYNGQRRQSNASLHSHHSGTSRKSASSYELDEETREKGLCPLPECGRVFKDLKAHMLTHQNERPEKCPITTCEYHLKGFARKYDKNRHTLTHYKGTMVCGFCPGSGSAAEKSFNRADVFKRHLTSVHGVEQNPPNSRKKSPTGRKPYSGSQQEMAGTCSTCSITFANAQEFYEHLDDCVLRVVQQADPSEAINQRLLTSVAEDKNVSETLDRNGLSNSIEYTVPNYDEEEEEDEDEVDVDDASDDTYGVTSHVGGGNPSKVTKASGARGPRAGLTFSKGGVAITGSGRKKRKNYPVSWGCPTDKMKMKKRVLCVYDGPRRLWKDDMMLDQEFEVRLKLPDGKSYVTDLDVQTLKRADALHDATPEEKGPWTPDNIIGGPHHPHVTAELQHQQYLI